MTIHRTLRAIALAITLPLLLSACSESLPEPELTAEPLASSSENPSTTVSTVSETVSEETVPKKETPEPDTQPTGPCDWTPFEQGQPGELVSMYCDGKHASIGTYATDHVQYFSWDGTDWVLFESSGTTYTGFACYDTAKAKRQGFPKQIIDRMVTCD